MEQRQYIEAGKIINTHGVRGEVKIDVWLDSPEYFCTFKTLYIDGEAVKPVSARPHKGFAIVKLDGTDDINAAMCLKNKTVCISRSDARLPKGGYFLQDSMGAKVVTEDGADVGVLKDILETPASLIYVVSGESEHMIPAVPEFVLETDAENGLITVRLIEGM